MKTRTLEELKKTLQPCRVRDHEDDLWRSDYLYLYTTGYREHYCVHGSSGTKYRWEYIELIEPEPEPQIGGLHTCPTCGGQRNEFECLNPDCKKDEIDPDEVDALKKVMNGECDRAVIQASKSLGNDLDAILEKGRKLSEELEKFELLSETSEYVIGQHVQVNIAINAILRKLDMVKGEG